MTEALKFLTNFIRHPASVGAIAPSSRWLADSMVGEMDLESAETVVELGPGTGAFTSAILDRIGPKGRYMAMELNDEFAENLATKHPDAHIVNDSAEKLPGYLEEIGKPHADSIICGLPWAAFGESLQQSIMSSVMASLPEGGKFATFAYIHAAWLPSARRFRRFLEAHFSRVDRTPIVWRNLPPAFVYRCSK